MDSFREKASMRRLWYSFYEAASDAIAVVLFICAFICGIVVVGVVLVGVLYAALDPSSCRAQSQKMGIEADWSFWTGCMVRLGDQWLPADTVIPVERDGKIVLAPRPVFIMDRAK